MTHPVARQKHYEQYDIQPIEFIAQVAGPEWCAGNVIKYLARYKEKNGVEDVYKALTYCRFLINILEGRNPLDDGKDTPREVPGDQLDLFGINTEYVIETQVGTYSWD